MVNLYSQTPDNIKSDAEQPLYNVSDSNNPIEADQEFLLLAHQANDYNYGLPDVDETNNFFEQSFNSASSSQVDFLDHSVEVNSLYNTFSANFHPNFFEAQQLKRFILNNFGTSNNPINENVWPSQLYGDHSFFADPTFPPGSLPKHTYVDFDFSSIISVNQPIVFNHNFFGVSSLEPVPSSSLSLEPPIFKCNFCSQTFSRKFVMERHTFVHTSETPYYCEFCQRGFKRKDMYNRHLDSKRCQQNSLLFRD